MKAYTSSRHARKYSQGNTVTRLETTRTHFPQKLRVHRYRKQSLGRKVLARPVSILEQPHKKDDVLSVTARSNLRVVEYDATAFSYPRSHPLMVLEWSDLRGVQMKISKLSKNNEGISSPGGYCVADISPALYA